MPAAASHSASVSVGVCPASQIVWLVPLGHLSSVARFTFDDPKCGSFSVVSNSCSKYSWICVTEARGVDVAHGWLGLFSRPEGGRDSDRKAMA